MTISGDLVPVVLVLRGSVNGDSATPLATTFISHLLMPRIIRPSDVSWHLRPGKQFSNHLHFRLAQDKEYLNLARTRNIWTCPGKGIPGLGQDKECLKLVVTINTLKYNTGTWSGQAILRPYLGHGTVEHLDIVKTRRTTTLQGQGILGQRQLTCIIRAGVRMLS